MTLAVLDELDELDEITGALDELAVVLVLLLLPPQATRKLLMVTRVKHPTMFLVSMFEFPQVLVLLCLCINLDKALQARGY